jgi:hypothetical protein
MAESNETATCSCTHGTHFLGRCQQPIVPPEKLCAECAQNHFTRNDDPTVVIE